MADLSMAGLSVISLTKITLQMTRFSAITDR